jgi:hypothetical protein
MDLQPNERETCFNMTGDNHNEWIVFTDDPFWQRRLERLGIVPVKVVGAGRHYRLTDDQVLIRKGKHTLAKKHAWHGLQGSKTRTVLEV